MSVTLKTGNIKYKNSQGEYISINGINDNEYNYKINRNNYLAPLFPSINGLPNIDTINKTLTIKALTTIYYEDYYLMNSDVVIDLTGFTNAAKKVIFNILTKEFFVVKYNQLYDNCVPIALIQFSSSGFKGMSINSEYTINDENSNFYFYKNYNVKSVNHRGYNSIAPENTLLAFILSKQKGFDWIETDVQFTEDNIPVILHDNTINRTARNSDGSELINDIHIQSITYNQALQYDFGIWKNTLYKNTKIPTFEQMISLCRNIGLKVRIELKAETVTTENIPILINIVKKYGMEKNVEWASFNYSLLQYISNNYLDYNIGYIVSSINSTVVSRAQALKTTTNTVIVSDNKNDTNENIQLLINANIPLDIYTITSVSDVINANAYVSSFTTNKLNAGQVLYENSINI